MPRANFDPVLYLTSQGPFKATGPIPAGENLKWIWVWVFQNLPNKAAAARGYGGPFGGNKWQVTLQVGPGDAFTKGRPALGSALALVDDGGGKQEVYWWSEALRILQ
jgi:hypothetical protein